MLKYYLTGLTVTILVALSAAFPVFAEESDTNIDSSVQESSYPTLDLTANGFDVVNLQCRLRDLGYYNYKITGYYGDLTKHSVKLFQKYNNVKETGVADSATNAVLYENTAVRMPMDGIDSSADRFGNTPTPKPTPKPTKQPSASNGSGNNSNSNSNSGSNNGSKKVAVGSYTDWSEVKNVFTKGTVATVYDFDTGISWKVKRTGGSKHADVEPVSKEDTALYQKALGKYYKNWKRHACVVVVNGHRYAASYHGYPHGYDGISSNNMTGHYCIHFKNSRTHCSNKIDPDHQACVKKAAGI